MYVRSSLTTNTNLLDDVIQEIEQLPRGIQRAYERRFERRIRIPMLEELETEPGPVKYPIEWESDKQRRAYFATDGFGGGIPTRRTKRIIKAWRVVGTISLFEGELTVENQAPAAVYVIGNRQQRFHRNTGWYRHDEITRKYSIKASDELIDLWYSLTT